MEVQVFNQDAIKNAVSMPRAIELMRAAFADLSAGKVDSPVRTVLTNEAGTVLYKPAYSAGANVFCAKVVSVFSGNAERGIPCLLYTSPSPRDQRGSRMPSSA